MTLKAASVPRAWRNVRGKGSFRSLRMAAVGRLRKVADIANRPGAADRLGSFISMRPDIECVRVALPSAIECTRGRGDLRYLKGDRNMSTHNRSLRAVAALEAAKGILVLIGAGAAAWILHGRPEEAIEAVVRHFHMNPARDHPRIFLKSLADFESAHALALSAGAVVYALIRFVEAYGLWHGRNWAWGFGILSAAIYVPFELIELTRDLTWASCVVLTLNVVIVVVLWQHRPST
jgi:uncharacterized membrane protein (DUF2068 family)